MFSVPRFFGLHSTRTFVYSKFIWKRIMDHLDTLWFPGWWLMFTQLKHIMYTFQGTTTSQQTGRGNLFFKGDFWWDMLVPRRVVMSKLDDFPPLETGFPKTKKWLTKTPIGWSWWHPFCSTTPEILRLCPSAAGILFDPQDRRESTSPSHSKYVFWGSNVSNTMNFRVRELLLLGVNIYWIESIDHKMIANLNSQVLLAKQNSHIFYHESTWWKAWTSPCTVPSTCRSSRIYIYIYLQVNSHSQKNCFCWGHIIFYPYLQPNSGGGKISMPCRQCQRANANAKVHWIERSLGPQFWRWPQTVAPVRVEDVSQTWLANTLGSCFT